MRNVYLAVVIVITVVIVVGSAVIFLMVRSSQSSTDEVSTLEPTEDSGLKIEPVPAAPQQSTGASEVEQPSEATTQP